MSKKNLSLLMDGFMGEAIPLLALTRYRDNQCAGSSGQTLYTAHR